MPQFDIITFFTQIFWLTIIFFGFYFITLQFFMPKIAAVIKARKKKLSHGTGGVFILNEEQASVEFSRNSSLETCADTSKVSVSFIIASADKWLLTSISGFNNTEMVTSQSSYVKTFVSLPMADWAIEYELPQSEIGQVLKYGRCSADMANSSLTLLTQEQEGDRKVLGEFLVRFLEEKK